MAIRAKYALRETRTNMRRNLFITVAAVLVVAVSLFQLGAAFLMRHAIARATGLVTANVEVSIFLSDDISQDQRAALEADLKKMAEVRTISYESKTEAFDNFKKLYEKQPDVWANVDPNALPASYRVKLVDPRKFEIISSRLQGRAGILSIRDAREVVEKVFSFVGALRAAALIMAIVVGIAATILIATTIRMALYARRRDIEIMKLVGATNWFIRIPFMLEGIAQGVIGVGIAVVLLLVAQPTLSGLGSEDFQLLGFKITHGDILVHGIFLLFVGAIVGAAGSLFGLRRFLDV